MELLSPEEAATRLAATHPFSFQGWLMRQKDAGSLAGCVGQTMYLAAEFPTESRFDDEHCEDVIGLLGCRSHAGWRELEENEVAHPIEKVLFFKIWDQWLAWLTAHSTGDFDEEMATLEDEVWPKYLQSAWHIVSPAAGRHRAQLVASNREVSLAERAAERRLVTNSVRTSVFERDGYSCCRCGQTRADGVKMVIDHVHPIAKGGKSIISNLETLCFPCNSGKSDKILSASPSKCDYATPLPT